VVQEQLHRVEIGAALQQTASGLAPPVVQVEIHLRELLAAAGKESAGRSPVRTVTECAKPKRRPGLLVVLEAFADFVAEHVRVWLERFEVPLVIAIARLTVTLFAPVVVALTDLRVAVQTDPRMLVASLRPLTRPAGIDAASAWRSVAVA